MLTTMICGTDRVLRDEPRVLDGVGADRCVGGAAEAGYIVPEDVGSEADEAAAE